MIATNVAPREIVDASPKRVECPIMAGLYAGQSLFQRCHADEIGNQKPIYTRMKKT
jgi:hypothetical protein